MLRRFVNRFCDLAAYRAFQLTKDVVMLSKRLRPRNLNEPDLNPRRGSDVVSRHGRCLAFPLTYNRGACSIANFGPSLRVKGHRSIVFVLGHHGEHPSQIE